METIFYLICLKNVCDPNKIFVGPILGSDPVFGNHWDRAYLTLILGDCFHGHEINSFLPGCFCEHTVMCTKCVGPNDFDAEPILFY